MRSLRVNVGCQGFSIVNFKLAYVFVCIIPLVASYNCSRVLVGDPLSLVMRALRKVQKLG